MRRFIIFALFFFVGCHSTPRVKDPVLRMEAGRELTAAAMLKEFGDVAGAEVSLSNFPVDSIRVIFPATIGVSLSHFQALLFNFRIGLEITRADDAITAIALREPEGDERLEQRNVPFVVSDSLVATALTLSDRELVFSAFQSARTVQRQQKSPYDSISGWPIPACLLLQDEPRYLRELVVGLADRFPIVPAPPESQMQWVTPFSLKTTREFYGE